MRLAARKPKTCSRNSGTTGREGAGTCFRVCHTYGVDQRREVRCIAVRERWISRSSAYEFDSHQVQERRGWLSNPKLKLFHSEEVERAARTQDEVLLVILKCPAHIITRRRSNHPKHVDFRRKGWSGWSLGSVFFVLFISGQAIHRGC